MKYIGLIILCFVLAIPQGVAQEPIIIVEQDSVAVVPDTIVLDRTHAIAIKTNLLYDAFYMPNFGWAPMPDVELEFFPRKGNFSYIAAFTFPYWHRWNKNKFFQIRDYRVEARYYLADLAEYSVGTGYIEKGRVYVGLSANVNKYGIGFNKRKGWQGEGLGASVTTGFVQTISKDGRWRIEYSLGVGYYETRFDPYVYGNPVSGIEDGDYYYDYTGNVVDFHRRNHRRRWFGPTQIGIKLSYDLFFFKKQKKGLGTHRFELQSLPEKERKEMVE